MNYNNEQNLPLQKLAITKYLQNLIYKIEEDKLDCNEIQKIYNILYLHFSNCNLDDNEERNLLDYTTIGWYINFVSGNINDQISSGNSEGVNTSDT